MVAKCVSCYGRLIEQWGRVSNDGTGHQRDTFLSVFKNVAIIEKYTVIRSNATNFQTNQNSCEDQLCQLLSPQISI
jgi:hypothetical protein